MSEITRIIQALTHTCGQSTIREPIGLHEPSFADTRAWDYVKDCLDTGWVSSAGAWVSRFEQALCNTTGAKYAIAVTNGTVALRLGLHLVGVKPGDEVLVPPLSFVATANAVQHLGATPHFVDIESGTLGMCPAALNDRLERVCCRVDNNLINRETGRRIAAVMPVHVFGNPAEIKKLKALSQQWGLPLVEDAAEALGSWYENTHCGLYGDVGALSFNGNKLITTGGGGALLTNNKLIAERARHLSTTAKKAHQWDFEHDEIGWNDRMPNINAALGVAQLEDIDRRLRAKMLLAETYSNSFSKFADIELIRPARNTTSNFWLNCLRFLDEQPEQAHLKRLEVLENAHAIGLMLRPVWKLLHEQPMYRFNPRGSLSVAESQACRLLNIPSSPQLLKA